MKSFIKFFTCGILFFSLSSSFSQQLGLSTQIIYFPSTSCLGCSDTFTVQIKNLDSTSYTGFVNISVSHDTNSFSVASLCSIPQVTIAGFDSVQNTCNITFDSIYFNTGSNIVVVWSSGNAKMPADTAWTTVLLNPAGVHETNLASAFTIYPSLAKDFITIESSENTLPKKIFITDVSGRIIKVISPAQESKTRIKINVAEFNSGIYFLDILLPNKQRIVSKFVKTD